MTVSTLPLPAEPHALRALVRTVLEQAPDTALPLVVAGEWIADPLWQGWQDTLEPQGMDRQQFGGIVAGYGNELRLWVVGERPWSQCVSGIAGRVTRRIPSDAPSAQPEPSPQPLAHRNGRGVAEGDSLPQISASVSNSAGSNPVNSRPARAPRPAHGERGWGEGADASTTGPSPVSAYGARGWGEGAPWHLALDRVGVTLEHDLPALTLRVRELHLLHEITPPNGNGAPTTSAIVWAGGRPRDPEAPVGEGRARTADAALAEALGRFLLRDPAYPPR